ncbi:MAG: hypothetical protein M3280_07855 [Actinomycetota bacterium]|nr:hypothetical protein [Actinomycetota bacterium]
MTQPPRRDLGLTMVETLSALVIFSLVTIGITPLLAMSMKGASLSRSYSVAKNLAVQSMERVRGLPFFESVKGHVSPTRQDVLDLYFPDGGAGYSAGTFTTTCTSASQTPATSGPAACPPRFEDGSSSLPAGLTLTFEAQFVAPDPDTAPGEDQEFVAVAPPANYNWATLATETPPAQLLRLTITARWNQAGAAKKYPLTSLLGERHLSPDNIRGDAVVDFTIQAVTSYVADDGRISTVTARAGSAQSKIESRTVAVADQTVRAGQLTLTNQEFNGVPGSTIADLSGAVSIAHAPPDSFYAPDVAATAQTISYSPNALPPAVVASIASSNATGVGVRVVDELPRAEGVFGFTGPTSDPTFWINNQADTGNKAALLLDPLGKVLTVHRDGSQRTTGSTKAESTALTPPTSRKVETTATASLGRVDLFPTTFITSERRAVVVIRDFTAELKCTSTASATAAVTGTWSAKLKYWRDPDNNPGGGAYTAETTISGSLTGGTDPLAAIKAANPKVYDVPSDSSDVWLFATSTQKGYLSDWSSKPQITWSKDPSGRLTSASLDGALQIVTAPTNPTVEATGLNITIGKLSCEAVDKRGT